MYDPNMPAPLPGQMQITSVGSGSGFPMQPQGYRSGVPQGGFGGGISPGGFPAFPNTSMAPSMGFGGQRPPMGAGAGGGMGGGFTPPQLPPQFAGMTPQMPQFGGGVPGNALGGAPMSPVPPVAQSFGENGRFGGFDIQGFMEALRAWREQRPMWQGYEGDRSAFRDARMDWREQRPDFWSFMNQQQAQAATTPPMSAPSVI